jgi:hypothetical protein
VGDLSVPTVEEVYQEAWGKVGGVGRLRRTFGLEHLLAEIAGAEPGEEKL